MTKADLKTGMVVEARDGTRFIVFCEIEKIVAHNEYAPFEGYHNDLINVDFKGLDIVKVYEVLNGFTLNNLQQGDFIKLIWQRKEAPQLTERERAYLKAYSYDYEWIARDEDGDLSVYIKKPKKFIRHGWWDTYDSSEINSNLLSFIKWEDEEPYKIKDLLGEE